MILIECAAASFCSLCCETGLCHHGETEDFFLRLSAALTNHRRDQRRFLLLAVTV